jgi:hypothetical protein
MSAPLDYLRMICKKGLVALGLTKIHQGQVLMGNPKKELQHVNEIELAVQSLTKEDWEAIDLAAFDFAKNVAIDPMWLLNEALERITDRRRKWPPNNPTPFRNFLCGVMKSIRNEVCKNLQGAIDCYYTQLEAYPTPPDEQLEHRDNEKWAKQVIETTFDHFDDDEDVLSIIIGKSEGLTGDNIRARENMTRKQYDAALKRLSRYRNANYPKGDRNE